MIPVGIGRSAQGFDKINPAVLAEAGNRLAGLGIQRIHPPKRGQHDDALVVTIAPIGDAAVQPAEIGRHAEPVLVDFWVEHPFGRAGRGVEGGDL